MILFSQQIFDFFLNISLTFLTVLTLKLTKMNWPHSLKYYRHYDENWVLKWSQNNSLIPWGLTGLFWWQFWLLDTPKNVDNGLVFVHYNPDTIKTLPIELKVPVEVSKDSFFSADFWLFSWIFLWHFSQPWPLKSQNELTSFFEVL